MSPGTVPVRSAQCLHLSSHHAACDSRAAYEIGPNRCREKVETLTVKEYDVREAKAAIGRLATVSHLASDRHANCHSFV